ncbi:MAG: hypothetical protein HY741_17765 [Chloroflexi bacterium]|nr:hypothetical protein [Chloroflexota bacterium]
MSTMSLDMTVNALTAVGTDLYLGGRFTETADGSVRHLNNIAKFDTVNSTWSALTGNGLDHHVYALAPIGADLYVGGYFNQTADQAATNLHHIAKYDTANNTWAALPGDGLNSYVFVFSVVGTDLYTGGAFSQTADGSVTNLRNIAKFDALTNAWLPMPNNGLSGAVYAIAAVGTDIYVGGAFTQTADGSVTDMRNIAKLNTVGNAWSPLLNNGLNDHVNTLAPVGDNLLVGGEFTSTADARGMNFNHIAEYDTTQACATQPPARPMLVAPKHQSVATQKQVALDWEDAMCATEYRVIVNEGSPQGPRAFTQTGLTDSNATTTPLQRGKTYFWKVVALNTNGQAVSPWQQFTVK